MGKRGPQHVGQRVYPPAFAPLVPDGEYQQPRFLDRGLRTRAVRTREVELRAPGGGFTNEYFVHRPDHRHTVDFGKTPVVHPVHSSEFGLGPAPPIRRRPRGYPPQQSDGAGRVPVGLLVAQCFPSPQAKRPRQDWVFAHRQGFVEGEVMRQYPHAGRQGGQVEFPGSVQPERIELIFAYPTGQFRRGVERHAQPPHGPRRRPKHAAALPGRVPIGAKIAVEESVQIVELGDERGWSGHAGIVFERTLFSKSCPAVPLPDPHSSTPSESATEKTVWAHERLNEAYGIQEIYARRDRMHQLISTILSHRTTHANETTAYQRMRERFPTWEAVRDAPLPELIETLRTANYPEVKAPNIQRVLARIIAERGEASIDFLEDLSTEEAMTWLMSLPGVGLKTATLVLLFNFEKPVLPVDTHVHRVMQRIGAIGPKVSAERAHGVLLERLPKDATILFNFHRHFYWHGQRVCTWSAPRCGVCVLQRRCDYFQGTSTRTPESTKTGTVF